MFELILMVSMYQEILASFLPDPDRKLFREATGKILAQVRNRKHDPEALSVIRVAQQRVSILMIKKVEEEWEKNPVQGYTVQSFITALMDKCDFIGRSQRLVRLYQGSEEMVNRIAIKLNVNKPSEQVLEFTKVQLAEANVQINCRGVGIC